MAQNTLMNLIGQLVPMVIGVVSIPLLIRHIGMDRFGLLSLVWIVIGYFTFFDLGLGRAIIKLVAEKIGARREEEIPQIFWNALLIMTCMSVLGSLVCFALTPTLVRAVFKIPEFLQHEAIYSFYALSFSLILVTLTAGFRGVLEAHQRFDFANLLHILMGTSTFVGPLVVSYFTTNLFVLVLVLVAVRMLIFIAHLWFVFKLYPDLRSPARIERATVKRLFRFATWMTVSNVVSPIMVYFDRFLLSAIVPVGQLAFYTTPYEIVNRLLVVPAAMVRTIFPRFAALGVERSRAVDAIFIRCVKWLGFVLFPTILMIVYFGGEALNLWLGENFATQSTDVLRILSIGILLNGIAFIPMTLLQSAERPDLSAKIHLIEFPFYLPFVWFMASYYGIKGAAIAWTVRVSVDMFLLFLAARYVMPSSGRELARLFTPFGLFLLFFLPPFLQLPLMTRIVLVPLILVAFFFLFWAIVLHLEDRLMVIRRFRHEMLPVGRPLRRRSDAVRGVWAIVVTFEPTEDVVANISSYLQQVDRVVVVDNGSTNESLRSVVNLIESLAGSSAENSALRRIELVKNGENLGIAAALNIGVKLAHEGGAEWIVTFDQDSRVDAGYIESMKDTLEILPIADRVGVIAPTFYDENTGRQYRATSGAKAIKTTGARSWAEVPTAFTSGALVKMSVFEKVGLFEDGLFIDYVDHEFALRLRSHGFLIVEAQEIYCRHRLGKMAVHKVGQKQFSSTHHGAGRRYTMARNRMLVYRRFFAIDPLWVLGDIKAFMKEFVKILLVEDQRFSKLASIFAGIVHGLKMHFRPRSGRLVAGAQTGRIGIVLATYRPPLEYLRAQLVSIASQSDQNWFCVVTDDGSDEELFAQVERLVSEVFAARDGQCYLVRRNSGRPGVVGNFADGLKALPDDCSLICFCDQDDRWEQDKLKVLRQEFADPGISLVHSDLTLVDNDDRELHSSCWAFEGRDVFRNDYEGLILRNNISGCAMMFRREVLEFCLPFPDMDRERPWFYHDVWIALGAGVYGDIKAIPRPLVRYRQHGGNVVGAEPAVLGIIHKGPWRSSWSLRKLEKAWKSRAILESAFRDRLGEWAVVHGEAALPRTPNVFAIRWDFGFFPLLLALRVGFRSPRYLKVALQIAAGKFFADWRRLVLLVGQRSQRSESLP